jgi:hypothetical protein
MIRQKAEQPYLSGDAFEDDGEDLIVLLAMLIRGATREGAIFQSVAALDNKLGVRDE